MSHSEVRNLPIRYRHWYLNRLVQHFEEKNKQFEESTSSNSAVRGSNNINNLNKFESQMNKKFT